GGPGLGDLMRARSFGMGGAYRALGGGTEAVEGNPASLAVFRRYLVELTGAWDPRNPFGFGSVSVMDSASGGLAAGLAYHLVSVGNGESHRVAHLNTAAFCLPFGQSLHVGVSARHVVMTGSRQANAITGDAGLLLRMGPVMATVSGHNLVDISNPDFPRTFAGALGLITPEFTLAADVRGDFDRAHPALSFSGGAEWVAGGALPLRAGFARDLIHGGSFVGAGIGFLVEGGGIDLGYRHELGGSYSRLLSVTFRLQVQ
ncbi:MAG TPA: hypothetical protein VE618_03600, partial [Myxococcaceae bacterium]|nr:hypothetical protein [Myxococcaceae bacterium]